MPITAARVAEIIEAFGGDPSRWPAAERDAASALIATQPALQAARQAAARLDEMLATWAQAPVTPVRHAATAAAFARRPRATRLRWFAGTGMAAAIAAAVIGAVVLQPQSSPPPTLSQKSQVARVAPVTVSDEQAFAMLFTPTPDEENLI